MKNQLLFFILFFVSINVSAQLTASERSILDQKQDSMKSFAIDIIRGRSAEARLQADSIFTRMFVKVLQTKNSFYYPFDSLITISRLTPADSSFRIFTWQLVINENTVRQHGAIQMNTKDGSLKLFPLIDKTPNMATPEDSVVNNFNWVGAVYYKIVEKKAFGKTYYTLLGFDENDLKSNKKIIEVLTFENGLPVFGGNHFSFPDNSVQKKGIARYIMTYKKNASPRLNYDPDMDIIIYEHLISETGEPQKKYTYVGDGDYEGLKWKDGKWVHINKVFTQKTEEGKEPVPHPILDEKGNIDESKLKDNRQKFL